MSDSGFSTPEAWRSGLTEIRDSAQAAMGSRLLRFTDVTIEVLDLANTVWGRHDISPDMRVDATARSAHIAYPYLYVKDRVIKDVASDISTTQGGYIDQNQAFLKF